MKKELLIKVGATIMQIVNLHTKDYLVNGSFRKILKIVMKNGEVDHLIIQFDDPLATHLLNIEITLDGLA